MTAEQTSSPKLDDQLLKKLDVLMKNIEKRKDDVDLMAAATDFLKVFQAYVRGILKPLNKSAFFLQNRSLETWDTVWRNE